MRSKIKYCLIILVFAVIIPNIISANTNILPYEDIYWENLLHYNNKKSHIPSKSSFFTSKYGFKNPKSEYEQILSLLKEDNIDIQCVFPARSNFIIDKENLENIDFNSCVDLLEYQQEVPIDYVEIAFACEDNSNPSSMLGHSFLILTGILDGIERKHVIEYATSIRNVSFFEIVSKGALGKLKGIYALYPYDEYKNKYLSEGRAIWKFKLNLNISEIGKLKEHIWELKDKESYYSLLNHNCNSALIDLLKVSNNSFEYKNNKPFITPIEYLQFLKKENKITDISIDLTQSAFKDIEKNGLKDILDSPKPSKVSLSYLYENSKSGVHFSIMPLYQDMFDINSASNDIRESKILNISANYFFNNKFTIDSIEIIKTRSLVDFSLGKFSKHFKLAVDNIPGSYNNLFPNIEFGLGITKNISNIKIYLMPYIGYRYKENNILYLVSELGLIYKMTDKSKFLVIYSPEFNVIHNNCNLSKLTGHLGYKISNDYSLFIESNYYPKLDHIYNFSAGIKKYF